MVDPTAFTDPENWTGGWYELALELGQRCDERLDHALRVWCVVARGRHCRLRWITGSRTDRA